LTIIPDDVITDVSVADTEEAAEAADVLTTIDSLTTDQNQ
jgi:hypothetical protein